MLIRGDARQLPIKSDSVQCCITSPPYWGLRDYSANGQIGLESTPEEYVAQMVAVFREVWRVLKASGTAWIVLGDSYAGSWGAQGGPSNLGLPPAGVYAEKSPGRNAKNCGLKPKDLVGIPWRVAFALQQPWYAGRIKREIDRVWLAAMIEAEGCMFIHRRKEGQPNGQGYFRQNDSYGSGLEVANTSEAVVRRCMEIAGIGSICSQGPEQNGRRKQRLYRWNVRSNECRWIIQEVYPYLVGKRQQARLVYGCPSSGEKATAAHTAVIGLHNGIASDVDCPEIPSLFSPGYYLRSEIIWSKCNPMPESVGDRPTKAHETVFLLTKSERYFYDAEAIREPQTESSFERSNYPRKKDGTNKGEPTGRDRTDGGLIGGLIYASGFNALPYTLHPNGRNKRSVWEIATESFNGAHFATFPRKLIEPMILAGSRKGDVVLDPFVGSGTTVNVARELGRIGIGTDLKYQELARERVTGGPLLAGLVNAAPLQC